MTTFTFPPDERQALAEIIRSIPPVRVVTSGHDLPCSACSFTIPAETAFFRVNGDALCQNCGMEYPNAAKLMHEWEAAQVRRLAEARKSERLIAQRERAQRQARAAHPRTEWCEEV